MDVGATSTGVTTSSGGTVGTWTARCLPSSGGNDLPAHLVAHYPLNGNTADTSPNQNPSPGVFSPNPVGGIPWTSDRKGISSAALLFDGQTGVDIPNAERLNGMMAFTLVAWVNPEVDNGIILAKVTPNRDFTMKLQPEQRGTLGAHFAINYDEYYIVSTTETPLLPRVSGGTGTP